MGQIPDKEIQSILEHDMRNALCAFGLQSQLLRQYLIGENSEEMMPRLLHISQRTELQIERLNDYIERLIQLTS